MRTGGAHFAIAALLATTGGAHATPARAAACGSPPPPVQPIRDIPWPQRWLATDRLNALGSGRDVVVAVLDSGVDARHPQLRGRVMAGRDFLEPARGNDGRIDCNGHGTAVASIIAASPADGTGLRGIAPEARILPVRISEQEVIDGTTSGRTVGPAAFAAAIRWAVDNGADVLNLSVVLYDDVRAVRDAVAYAVAEDVVVVAAVGNLSQQGNPTPYPAAYDELVIGVGAIGADGLRLPFSQVGEYVDVMAPGAEVTVAVPGGGHSLQSGTSYAAPFASGTAALVRQLFPGLSEEEVRRRLEATTDPAPGGRTSQTYGLGNLDPYRAATALMSGGDPVRLSPLPPARKDPAAAAARARAARVRAEAIRLAVGGVGLAGLVVIVAMILKPGMRRRWRSADAVGPRIRARHRRPGRRRRPENPSPAPTTLPTPSGRR
jgi:membrane-anchored mycosin MYCP